MSWRLGNENSKNSKIRNVPSLYREAGRASSWLPGAACTFSWSPTGISFYSAGQGKSETHPCSHPLRTSAQLSLLRTLTRVTFERLLCDGLKKKKFPWRIILIKKHHIKKNIHSVLLHRDFPCTPSLRPLLWAAAQLPSQSLGEQLGAVCDVCPSFLSSSWGTENPLSARGRVPPWPTCYGATGGTSKEALLCESSSGRVSRKGSNVFQMPPTASLFMFPAFTVKLSWCYFYKSFPRPLIF